ncbi:GNAT family N-acetyltransferase, partial [Aeromicrobium sp. REDSEA-S38_B2]
MRALDVLDAGPEHAEAIVDIIHRSFSVRPDLDPPSTALDETVESVSEVLATAGGLLVERRGVPMGALLFDESRPGKLGLRRVSVDPEIQARGVASAMVGVAEDTAEERGKDGIWLHVREELPDTVRFWT